MTAPPTYAPNTAKLLPCPFCGGSKIHAGHIRDGRSVGCRDCGASVFAFSPDAEPRASEKWNTRASARAPSGEDRREEVAANGIAKLLRDWAGDSARVTYPALREDLIKAAAWIDGLAALLNAPQWEPIETAPKDGARILLGWHGQMSAEGFWHDGLQNYWKLPGFYFADDDLLTGKPSDPDCWTPLPVPPDKSAAWSSYHDKGGAA